MALSFFNTHLALIQAPMAGVQDFRLAAAVSNAGGLGSLPCAMLSKQQLVSELDKLTQATSNPYNLNFFCHTVGDYTSQQKQQWHNLLAPYFDEYGIDAESLTAGASRQPISQSVVDIIAPYKPAVVSFHFGLPEQTIMAQIKSWGTKVISTATTLDEAIWLSENGADAIIAQGLEAGGHRGHFLSMDLSLQQSTVQLVQNCVARLSLPIVAAGGIATADDVEQMQALGAAAVQVGSAYLLCCEAQTSALHKQAILNQKTDNTALTTLFSGRAARGIQNRVMDELGALAIGVPEFPHASTAITALRASAEKAGHDDFSPLWCGQKHVPRVGMSAEDITYLLMKK
ncbi:nitronate monooxygenase [Pseudoalteromonas sp. SG43-7]|uniref:NAD(P)H-dependent flavin oxidoreductase n=1 Tax=unclassified Pseudoalteromonas TaxID=194690 RepID=UPI001602A41E|nr:MULTISPECIES: nitronate monooxygenase [unclassified Pseudoalteromonas]MBB1417920.1 nitronate monooxygenase [Pseudoalteromonas sp. SG44-1]MBB1422568.1 nitronate monooxygenase [Pseudoalteromonas sp. SG43-7]